MERVCTGWSDVADAGQTPRPTTGVRLLRPLDARRASDLIPTIGSFRMTLMQSR